mgnify:FL=1|jgi:hypothetical protein
MKKIYVVLIMIQALIICPLYGQINLAQDSLIRKIETSQFSGTVVFKYSDRINVSENRSRPVDKEGVAVEMMEIHLNSIEKLNQILQRIFTKEEILSLYNKKCMVDCIVLSSGKIVSASFQFSDEDTDIRLSKLIEFSKAIKKNLSFKIYFNRKIENDDSSVLLTFPAVKNIHIQ